MKYLDGLSIAVPSAVFNKVRKDTPCKIFPNAADSKINIHFFCRKSGNTILSLYNLTGRKMPETANSFYNQGNHRIVYETNSLKQGLYILEIKQ